MGTVLDYSVSPISASAIRDAGHVGAVRYLSPPREAWMKGKPATAEEAQNFKTQALDMAFVWQYGGASSPDAMRGREGGLADATNAGKQLKAIARTGYPVFFAVDFDITLDQWNTTAVEYFKAACEVLGRERVGIYGHSRVIAWAHQDGVIADLGGGKALAWQTKSWSGGQRAPEAVLYQGTHNVTGPEGIQVDVNEVLHDYWGQAAPGTTTPPQDKKKEAPVADNAVDIDLHHLIPFGNPTPLPKKRIIVHTTENTPGTSSRNILDYQVRTRTGSYHRLVDASGQITLANTDDWQTWSVGNKGNDIALHVSLVAQAKMTRAEWLAQPKMLEGAARVIAYWARTYDIPLVKLTREELGAGKHGVAGHLEAQVWGNTDHWDPGYEFPYDVVLARAKEINAGKTAPAVAIPPAPVPKAPLTLDTPCKSHVPGSTHVAPLADYIMYIDRGVFESRRMIDANAQRLEALDKKFDRLLELVEKKEQ
ncbi:glycoside hydrolase domain-containing protein [Corynebacterium lactis]|uniref:N-acetylmuramoyl-L-alanine amidase domain-containing protein n=1 Tax=Corynebacterium lactis RW2-5 TaxID=1408189 RepID=A0A0K2H0T9_9CORY|nr:glycoside hydrolase domain-containing protein [Corynebacterium lactis]ALA67558.1 hypothetical protein CLAC_07250 [Corynebacterium lactis RW2-5]